MNHFYGYFSYCKRPENRMEKFPNIYRWRREEPADSTYRMEDAYKHVPEELKLEHGCHRDCYRASQNILIAWYLPQMILKQFKHQGWKTVLESAGGVGWGGGELLCVVIRGFNLFVYGACFLSSCGRQRQTNQLADRVQLKKTGDRRTWRGTQDSFYKYLWFVWKGNHAGPKIL